MRWTSNVVPSPLQGNAGQMVRFINRIAELRGDATRFVVYSPSKGYWTVSWGSKKLVRAIEQGHLDLSVWLYANPMKCIKIKQSRNGKDIWISKWVIDGETCNWSLDMDNVPNCNSFEELIIILTKNQCPLPKLAIQTGPSNFHLLYVGKNNYWTKDRRYMVAALAAGLDHVPDNMEFFKQALERGGVDYQYLVQNPDTSKIRIPGSVNENHSVDKENRFIGNFVCDLWVNPDSSDSVLNEKQLDVIEEKIVEKEEISAKDQYDWRKNVDKIAKAIEPFFSAKTLQKAAEFFAKNMGWIRQGNACISQRLAAEAIGIKQPSISRIFKSMVEAGFLIVQKGGFYIPTVKPKTYDIGPEFKKVFVPMMKLEEEYIDGNANEQILSDIRTLVALGLPNEKVSTFIYEKQSSRPYSKRRSLNELDRKVRYWHTYKERWAEQPIEELHVNR